MPHGLSQSVPWTNLPPLRYVNLGKPSPEIKPVALRICENVSHVNCGIH